MIDDSRLFTVQQECSRALGMVQEAVEEAAAADQRHGLPSVATERARAALDALGRLEVSVAGLKFQLKRAESEYSAQSDWDAA